MIQAVTFLSPIVGGHEKQPLISGHVTTQPSQKGRQHQQNCQIPYLSLVFLNVGRCKGVGSDVLTKDSEIRAVDSNKRRGFQARKNRKCDRPENLSLQFQHVKLGIISSWWLNQAIWKICWSNWIIFPGIGVNIKKYVSCHHLYI